MGKGDKRTKRGKLFRGSHGKTLKRKSAAPKPEAKPAPARAPRQPRPQPTAPPEQAPAAEEA